MFGWFKRKPPEPKQIQVWKAYVSVELASGETLHSEFIGTAARVSGYMTGTTFLEVKTARGMFEDWRARCAKEDLVSIAGRCIPMRRVNEIRVEYHSWVVTA